MFDKFIKKIMGKAKKSVDESDESSPTRLFNSLSEAMQDVTACIDGLQNGQHFNIEMFTTADGEICVHFSPGKILE